MCKWDKRHKKVRNNSNLKFILTYPNFPYLCCMIHSMTGYGKAVNNINDKKFTIEVRSLNSKGIDMSVRMPSLYREKELALRKYVGKALERGKIDLSIYYEATLEQQTQKLNKDLVASYYKDIKELETNMGINNPDPMAVLLKMPDVFKSERPELDEDEWTQIMKVVDEAIVDFKSFRKQEGDLLFAEFTERVNRIQTLLKDVVQYEQERIDTVKERIAGNIEELVGKDKIDENRLEQEIIFYIEKFDVSEEKSRLEGHCNYFKETMSKGGALGKKLGFIAQEMGREINTLGSKANHAEIQKIVVQMKDELEKIKEQILNTL